MAFDAGCGIDDQEPKRPGAPHAGRNDPSGPSVSGEIMYGTRGIVEEVDGDLYLVALLENNGRTGENIWVNVMDITLA